MSERTEFLYGWIDARAAVIHLGLGSTRALRRLITEHRLPYRRVGRHYRFRRADLDEWMDASVGKGQTPKLWQVG